jgi:hypothetical protein
MRMSSGASNRYENPRSARSSCGLPLAVLGDQIAERFESSVCHACSRAEACEPETSGFDSVGVTVDPEQFHVGTRVEHQGGVSTTTDGAVDDQAGRNGQEEFHDLPRHHREMREFRLHVQLLTTVAPGHLGHRPRLQPPGRQAPPGMSPRVGYG